MTDKNNRARQPRRVTFRTRDEAMTALKAVLEAPDKTLARSKEIAAHLGKSTKKKPTTV